MQRAMSLSAEKGGSSWLSTLPIAEHAFILHKSAFHDALCLRYSWRPSGLPLQCSCGKQFTVEHTCTLSCSHGGYPSIRHNELRDIIAELMSQVCHNVGIEPSLQPVTDEHLVHRTANRDDSVRLDVAAESFWGSNRQRTFFDTRVFNPFAPTYCNTPLWLNAIAGTRRRRKGLGPENKRNRTWMIFTTRFFYHRRYGNNSYSCLQEACLFNCRKVRETLQQDHAVDPVQAELLTALLSHHVLAWIQVLTTQPCTS